MGSLIYQDNCGYLQNTEGGPDDDGHYRIKSLKFPLVSSLLKNCQQGVCFRQCTVIRDNY